LKVKAIKSCRNCGNLFVITTQDTRNVFCSHSCHNSWRSKLFIGKNNPNYKTGGNKTCQVCGVVFKNKGRDRNRKYCSLKCARSIRIGEKSPDWQGGKTSKNMAVRNSVGYSTWRNLVFERDNYTCQKCGIRGGRLTAHHVKEFSDYPDFRMDVSNGQTICFKCHGDIHRGKPRPGGKN
jgi:5-methylcytosine-specific restriction endonuclease McrA